MRVQGALHQDLKEFMRLSGCYLGQSASVNAAVLMVVT